MYPLGARCFICPIITAYSPVYLTNRLWSCNIHIPRWRNWALVVPWARGCEFWGPVSPSLTTLETMGAVCVCVCGMCAQSYLTLCDPMDCSPPGSSVHGTFPGKNTRVGCHFLFRGFSWFRDWTHISCTSRKILYHCTSWEAPGGLSGNQILIRINRYSLEGIYTGSFPRIYTGKLRVNQQLFAGKRADMKHRRAEAKGSCLVLVPLEVSAMSPCSGKDHSHLDPRELGRIERPWSLTCLFHSGPKEALRSIIGFIGKLPSPTLFS